MSNSRRAADSAAMAESYAAGYSCPDCDSRTELAELAPRVYSLEVRHDESCPVLRWLAAR